MTQQEAKIIDVLNQYCDQHGGGMRQIETTTGRYGGFYVSLYWSGFDAMGFGARHNTVSKHLIDTIGPGVFTIVRKLHLRTLDEKIEEEAIAGAIPADPPWLRP